jgi:S-adenosylmethionine decarboxylase
MKKWFVVTGCVLAVVVMKLVAGQANVSVPQAKQTEAVASEYQFIGRHLLASYHGCDPEALKNIKQLPEVMKQGVKESGAQLLDSVEYVFQPNGLTMVLLLSESHASIHTYPEHDACFVDFFTCGTNCSAEKFDAVLQQFLKPKKTDSKIFMRD